PSDLHSFPTRRSSDLLEKGELRRPNPEYRQVQRRRHYLAKIGKIDTEEYRELGVQMRKLPSLDPKDPNFVRVHYVRYADDWVVGDRKSTRLNSSHVSI